jgi:FtsH-binding integral membrane protein
MTGMLFLAIADLPYGYYQLLRWVVCGVAIYIAYMAYQWGKAWATWVFGLIAVLFNPILPVYLTKAIWRPIDLTCGVLFALSTLFLKEPTQGQDDRKP